MSSPEKPRRIVLSPRARQDFIDILRYTGERWGQGQLHTYRDRLNEALQTLAVNPQMGRRSGELPETHRLHRVGSHVIVYRDLGGTLAVVRILHQRMQLAAHIQGT